MVLDDGAGLHEAGGLEVGEADQCARAEHRGGGDTVGLGGDDRTQNEGFGAETKKVARGEAEALGDQAFDRHGVGGERRDGWFEGRAADEGPGQVGGFDFDQHALAVGGDEHGAQGGDVGKAGAAGLQPGAQGVGQRLRAALDVEVATEDAGAVGGHAAGDAFAQGANGGDGGDAECEAGQHDGHGAEAGAGAPPQFAEGEAEGQFHAAIRPSAMRMMRPQRAASAGS